MEGRADPRPIALTDVSYKMVMKVVKEEIERHLEKSGMVGWEQAGFTKGRDFLILAKCVHQAYKKREQLVVVVVDF